MLKIRLRRMGSKQDACYRVVVSDSRSVPTGRFIETIGVYDPGTEPSTLKIDVEKADTWIAKGAHPSGTVKSLISKARKAQA